MYRQTLQNIYILTNLFLKTWIRYNPLVIVTMIIICLMFVALPETLAILPLDFVLVAFYIAYQNSLANLYLANEFNIVGLILFPIKDSHITISHNISVLILLFFPIGSIVTILILTTSIPIKIGASAGKFFLYSIIPVITLGNIFSVLSGISLFIKHLWFYFFLRTVCLLLTCIVIFILLGSLETPLYGTFLLFIQFCAYIIIFLWVTRYVKTNKANLLEALCLL